MHCRADPWPQWRRSLRMFLAGRCHRKVAMASCRPRTRPHSRRPCHRRGCRQVVVAEVRTGRRGPAGWHSAPGQPPRRVLCERLASRRQPHDLLRCRSHGTKACPVCWLVVWIRLHLVRRSQVWPSVGPVGPVWCDTRRKAKRSALLGSRTVWAKSDAQRQNVVWHRSTAEHCSQRRRGRVPHPTNRSMGATGPLYVLLPACVRAHARAHETLANDPPPPRALVMWWPMRCRHEPSGMLLVCVCVRARATHRARHALGRAVAAPCHMRWVQMVAAGV